MEKLRAQMQISSQILQVFRQSEPLGAALGRVCAALLELGGLRYVYFYKFEKPIACLGANPEQFRERDWGGAIMAEAIAPSCQLDPPTGDLSDAILSKLINNPKIQSYANPVIDNNHLLIPLTLASHDVDGGVNIQGSATQLEQVLWGFLGAIAIESPNFSWDQDDLLLWQNVAMQSEIAIARDNHDQQLQIQAQDAEQAYNNLYHWTEQYRYLVEQVPSVSYLSPLADKNADESVDYTDFAYISPQVQELLGLPVSSYTFTTIFKEWQNYVHPEDRDWVYQKLQDTLDTGVPFFCEYRMVRRDGKIIWVSDTARIGLLMDGKTMVLRGSVYDISDRKNTEAQIAAAQIAEAANQSKSTFLAVMSHEIRTPMNTVIGMTDLLLNTDLSSQQKHYVSTIRQGGEMLLSIVDDILDFSRIEAGQMELEESCFKLQECVNNMLAMMSARAEQKSLSISVSQDPSVPTYIIGDHGRLRQILVNLVNNAIKFTQQGGITIGISSQLLSADANIYRIMFDVIDTGVGIDPDSLKQLFQSFRQADSSISRQYGGTGLGLVICKQLCEMMGGSIHVQSEVGKGSTFSFSICAEAVSMPNLSDGQDAMESGKDILQYGVTCNSELANHDANQDDHHEKAQQALELRIGDRYPLQILVVEDNSVNREILLLMLDKMGYLAESVSDGKEAVDVVCGRKYDLVFMDLQMPIMDGITATKHIRQFAKHQPWIVGLSANAFSDFRDSALAAGMDDYVTKPLQAETLSMVVTNAAQQNHFKNLNDLNHRSNYSPFIDVKTLTRLGDSIGKENVSNLVDAYLEHTAIAIAAMQRAILQHDFVTIEAECHSLKGGSSTFGATRLVDLCQEIESCSRYYIGAKHFTSEDIAKAQKLLDRMHSEYNILKQSIHRVLLAILDNGENALALTAQPLADKQLPQK